MSNRQHFKGNARKGATTGRRPRLLSRLLILRRDLDGFSVFQQLKIPLRGKQSHARLDAEPRQNLFD